MAVLVDESMIRALAARPEAVKEFPVLLATKAVRACCGKPAVSTDFSISAPVGHASIQAQQETHSDSRKGSLCDAETRDSRPRPSMVSANVPWVSSQARTQREHTMHKSLSKRKYGLL